MTGSDLGYYLAQFYENGPYVHKANNRIPYKAAFFGENFETRQRLRINMFDDIIRKMQDNERAFYQDMDVADIGAFNNKYMQGTDILKYNDKKTKTKTPASKIKGNFFQKVQYLILVPLRDILTLKIQDEDINKIIQNVFTKDPKIYELLHNLVGETVMQTFKNDNGEIIDYIGLILAANIKSSGEKKSAIKSSDYVSMRGATQGLVRDKALEILENSDKTRRLNPIIQEEVTYQYTKTILDKEIRTRVKKANALLRAEMLPIIESSDEFADLSDTEKHQQSDYYIRMISTVIDNWANEKQYQTLFKNTGVMTGSIGEFAIAFSLNVQVNQDPIIKSMVEVDNKIKSIIKSMKPGSMKGEGDITTYTPGFGMRKIQRKKYNSEDPNSHRWRRHGGQITQDIVYEGKSGRRYAFSVKNYLAEILEQGIKNSALMIRQEKNMSTFMGDILNSKQAKGTGIGLSVTKDDINRFVYVQVNNIFRREDNGDLLNVFMGGLINFYLQNQFIRNLTHVSAELKSQYGDVRNSFIVMAGMYLIPMSRILIGIRDNLQLALNKQYEEMRAGSLFSLNGVEYQNVPFSEADLINEKREIMMQDNIPGNYSGGRYHWPGEPMYGSRMLAVGIRAGRSIYEKQKMPAMQFKVDQLIDVLSINVNT